MNRDADIQFLQQFRAVVADYLGGLEVSPASEPRSYTFAARMFHLLNRSEDVRRAIVQGRRRAHDLLTECGCQNMTLETAGYPGIGAITQKKHRLFDILLDNPTDGTFLPAYFLDPIDEAIGVLHWRQQIAQIERPKETDQTAPLPDEPDNTLAILEWVALRLPRVAAQLARRHGGRAPFELQDEYDVQDLFRALLQIAFDDVRSEEPTPSHAGSSTRIDFMLANEGVMIEIKMTRPGLDQRRPSRNYWRTSRSIADTPSARRSLPLSTTLRNAYTIRLRWRTT